MFFILSKLLAFFISPFFWVFCLLLAGVLVKRQPLKKRFLIASLAVLYFFSNSFILNEVMIRWEMPAIQQSEIKGKYDVAIVLGGYTDYDSKFDRVQFQHGADRLFQALELYKKGMVKKILIDGGSGNLKGTNIEAANLHKYLLNIGVPDSAMIFEPRSRNTRENATFVKPILDSVAKNGRYLLITSGYHMRRAIGCFNKAGISTLAYSTDRIAGPMKFDLDYMFIPDLGAIYCWEALLHEWIGYMSYKMAGYL
ncbi:MAG TPA: YdcF family protein [Bacteroidia bacterium]|nr:YdcF family protein [Bacteroidia bacterium]